MNLSITAVIRFLHHAVSQRGIIKALKGNTEFLRLPGSCSFFFLHFRSRNAFMMTIDLEKDFVFIILRYIAAHYDIYSNIFLHLINVICVISLATKKKVMKFTKELEASFSQNVFGAPYWILV